MDVKPKSNRTKQAVAVAVLLLAVALFVWAMFLLLGPIDEKQREVDAPLIKPDAPSEVMPAELPATGYGG